MSASLRTTITSDVSDTSTSSTFTSEPTGHVTPEQLGVGARVSIHPHCDAYLDVVLGALRDVQAEGLTDALVIETDDVSTWVGVRRHGVGDTGEEHLARYLTGLVAAAHRRARDAAGDRRDEPGAAHVAAHLLLSRGCPGEVTCDLAVTGLPTAAPVDVPVTGVPAAAQWSLYPLLEGVPDAPMDHIEAAVASAVARGTATGARHYATRLEGDLAEVVATAVDAWAAVGAVVPHVVSHLTLSVGSPSAGAPR